MSLELDPVELGFRRPFTNEVEEKLRLHNPNNSPVAFKVKTTAPKQYCVRPNSGRIEAGQQVEVAVLLQAMKEEPPLDAKCRDKFLVQSVALAANDETTNIAGVWANIEQTSKSSIQEKKIRVNFLPSSGSVSTPSRSTAAGANSDDLPPAYGSPLSTAATPFVSSKGSAKDGYTSHDASDATDSVGTATAHVTTNSSDELKAQLDEAHNKIAALTRQASEGLRQRKSAAVGSSGNASSGSTETALQQQSVGVTVPVVAGLCLLSFLLAYLLF